MSSAAPRPGPLGPVAVAAAGLAVVAAVLAAVRPWGDVGVAASGALVFSRPTPVLTAVTVVAVLAAVAAVATARGRGRWAGERFARTAGAVVVALAVLAVVVVLAVLSSQVFPRDGGWFGLLAAVASGVAGLAVACAGAVRPRGGRATLVTTAVAAAVPVALVVVGTVVAPGWAGHVVDGSYPASFSESPGQLTVGRVGWRQDFGADSTVAVLGGRVIVATDTGADRDCRLRVRALDAGTGAQIWSSARTLRCDGPRLATVDGNNTTVRVTLRADVGSDRLSGPPVSFYVGTEDGRPRSPSGALDDVAWWTEGFGLVQQGGQLRGLDSVTGRTAWSRPAPACPDGGVATVELPAALPAGALGSRTPYDGLGSLPGSVPVTGVGNDVVLGASCGGTPQLWTVAVTGRAADDHLVALPGRTGAGDPTTFLAFLDTVVAVTPTGATQGSLHPAALTGVDLATGRVLWTHPARPLTSIDLSPVDGGVHLSEAGDDTLAERTTVVLDLRSGATRSTGDAAGSVASVSLNQARITFDPSTGVSVVDARTGATTAAFAVPDCALDPRERTAALLAGPGGVVVRCLPKLVGGASVVGLVP